MLHFIQILLVGAEFFHAKRTEGRTEGRTDGRTDVTKLTDASHSFAKAPKKVNSSPSTIRRNVERTELYLHSLLNSAVDRG